MRSLHCSGLASTKPPVLRAALTEWAAEGYGYLSHTEMGDNARAAVLHEVDGYGVVQAKGWGADECALMYRLDLPAPVEWSAPALSALGIPRRGGKLCHALVVKFPDHTRVIVHMPSGVEGLTGLRRNAQGEVYRAAIEGLKTLVASIDGPLIITGDFNLSIKRKWVRAFFERHFPGFSPTAVPAKTPGTHGRRVIDFSLARGFTSTGRVVSSLHSSDHRAIRERFTKETAVTDPYAITTHDGRRVDELTHQALLAAEKILGYELTITQGSYNAGKVSASAGTHDGGGVVDLAPFEADRKVRALRSIGFAAWRRRAIPGLWPEHVHAVLIGNRRLSDAAARQVQAYLAGRNGLADNGPDDGPREFIARRFAWTPPAPPKPPKPTRVERARALLAAALRFAGPRRKAAIQSALDDAPER